MHFLFTMNNMAAKKVKFDILNGELSWYNWLNFFLILRYLKLLKKVKIVAC